MSSTLLAVSDALAALLEQATAPVKTESRSLLRARGCVLAEDIRAAIAVPGEDNSAMDGYALRAADAAGPLPVTQRIPAGASPRPLAPGTAARIFTGAPVPTGADTVVMQENCVEEQGVLRVQAAVTAGANIRRRGQDLAEGDCVLRAGRRLSAADLGLLASVGHGEVTVFSPLRVALLSTGDELVEPGTGPLGAGQVYNSNRVMLAGLLQALGLEVVDCGIVADDVDATAIALRWAATNADCVISSGGVSVGEEDHIKEEVRQLGELLLWRLAIKPGKPLAFGNVLGVPFIGLPGNPVSSYVTFCLLARPFLLRCQGATELAPLPLSARAAFAVTQAGSRQEYLRVNVQPEAGGLVARPFANQSSGVLSSVCQSNALAVIPVGATVAEGDQVEILLLDTFG
ncbi:molybdopterin molybdenumtransferase MoeA [Kineobactrum sediminis]|uniref:Molybdopterin molybdenumtransferase n=1 Tax=Kineobactrum sediminis TaxID=1905677 RepID=A0A2N5XYC1_9GAMM|nr:gephyrin-like molybdotransferase Glp [Kineobactrum sediminis]PLW81141.1 molybdopterin molybdenumtransferase MoeA [Kineobactrum sediminis]